MKKYSIVRVAKADPRLPPVGTLGTVLVIDDLRAGVQWGPNDRGFITMEQFANGTITVFQP